MRGGGGNSRAAGPLAAAPEPLVPPPPAGALIGDSQARMRQAAEWIYANGKSFKDAAKRFNVTAAGARRAAPPPQPPRMTIGRPFAAPTPGRRTPILSPPPRRLDPQA